MRNAGSARADTFESSSIRIQRFAPGTLLFTKALTDHGNPAGNTVHDHHAEPDEADLDTGEIPFLHGSHDVPCDEDEPVRESPHKTDDSELYNAGHAEIF